jgi:hypothetical protein
MGLKAAVGDLQSRAAQPFGKISIEPVRPQRRRRVRERRPVPFAAVAVQSKLRNHQGFAARVAYRKVHLALVVFKDAEIFDLVGERFGVLLVIFFTDAEEDAQAGTDPTDRLLSHADAGFCDSLDDGAHGEISGFSQGQVTFCRRRHRLARIDSQNSHNFGLLPLTKIRGVLNTSSKTLALYINRQRLMVIVHRLLVLLILSLLVVSFDSGAAELDSVAGEIGIETIRGTVSVAGNYQRPKPLPVFKNRAFCGASVANETLLIGSRGGLRNAVVLFRLLEGKAAAQPSPMVLDNKHCAFAPHVQVAPLGSELLLKNSDPILHTVHARIGNETLFNVGLPKWRQVTKRLDRLGVIRINCDVLHTWMSAAIVVSDTPYFAVTDDSGRFGIDGLAAGRYEMDVWHERLGAQSMRLAVAAGTPRFVEVVYSSK